MLRRKDGYDIDKAISSPSSASMIGAAAAITNPPQIAVPNQLRSVSEISDGDFPEDPHAKKALLAPRQTNLQEDKPEGELVTIDTAKSHEDNQNHRNISYRTSSVLVSREFSNKIY